MQKMLQVGTLDYNIFNAKINQVHLIEYTKRMPKLTQHLLKITRGKLTNGERSTRGIQFYKKLDFHPIRKIISQSSMFEMMLIIQKKLRQNQTAMKKFENVFEEKMFIKNVLLPEAIAYYLKDIADFTKAEAEAYIGGLWFVNSYLCG